MLPKSVTLKRLFDYDFPSSWRKPPKCAVCCNELSIGSHRLKNGHRPMILNCYHTACDKCLFNCRAKAIVCKQCKKQTKFIRDIPIRQYLEFNYYLYGVLVYNEHILRHDIKQFSPITVKPEMNQYECHECNSRYTDAYCIQCSVPYCQVCFRNVHKYGKALKKHCLSSFKSNILLHAQDMKKCSLHQRVCNISCVDCKSEICSRCMNEHNGHEVKNIAEENKKIVPQLLSVIESVKIAREHNRQAQKAARAIEKKYEDFAGNVIENITNYFIAVHAALQVIERQYLITIKNKTIPSLEKVKSVISTLTKGAQTLDEIKETLEKFGNDLPNIPLTVMIERTNMYLESMPCNVEFENCDENPFTFNILNDTVAEIKKCHQLNVKEQSLTSKLVSYLGGNSCSEDTSFEGSFNDMFASLKLSKEKSVPSSEELSRKILKPLASSVVNTQKGFVSYIQGPNLFYFQKESFVSNIDDFQTICKEEAEFATTPDYIELNQLYLVFDPNTKIWFRAKVIEKPRDNIYKVLLIDIGQHIDIPKQRFREISKDLSSQPVGALACSIYGIKPQNKTWSDEATLLMNEIVQNESVTVIFLCDNGDKTWLVDIVAHQHKYPTSVRDALLFTNLGEPAEVEKKEIFQSLESIKRNLIPSAICTFFKNVFKNGESFKASILNIISPQEFYAAKYDHNDCIENLYKELNEAYEQTQPKIYVPQINMPCAVAVNGNWLRARITKLLDNGNCRVWLVDRGQHETIHWKKIRTLQENFLKTNENVFQCSLVDIEPRQENDYTWTEKAIAEFKRITKNSTLQIFIHKSKEFRYKVSVYVVKKNVDFNVNALMVKYGHALSTGIESTCVEYPKVPETTSKEKEDIDLQHLEKETSSKLKINTRTLMKTKIKITHIISPGEFYIHLNSHIKGIKSLHGEIQISQQRKRLDGYKIKSDWQVGDNCLVLCSIKKDTNHQWYRGFITTIYATEKETKYTIFLRDYGNKCADITIENLAPIDQLHNRICNGAIKCHMACVQPTGGLEIWSYSSIDELKNILEKFECLSATIQGERKEGSIPVILFGMTTECADPLSPNINKWVNINKVLVNCGLAHLTEKFDLMIQNEKTLENEHKEIQLSFTHSFDTLRQIDAEPQQDNDSEFSYDLKMEKDDDIENETKEMSDSWLPPKGIEKTVFTAYPTFIDTHGIVYLHDGVNEAFLTKMRDSINKLLAETEPDKDVCWKVGQACIAKYHLDQLFYRATIVKLEEKDKIIVQFVDYGNPEECSPEDLRKIILLQHIPIQANKYIIDGIKPKNGETFSIEALDYIHSQIVSKLCSIRVSENQEKETIKRCSIRFEIYDIAELLLSQGYAVKCHTKVVKNPICNNQSTDDEEESIIFPRTPVDSSPIKTALDTDDYQKMFEKIELENLYNSIFEDSFDAAKSDDDDIIELEHTFQTGYWQKKCENSDTEEENKDLAAADSSSVSSFNPLETSSVTSRYEFFKKFPSPEIPTGLKTFYCEVTFIRDSTHLFISPCITELQRRFADMSTQIQHLSKSCAGLKNFQPNTPCLALYNADSLWYRAIIRSFSPETEKAEVVFVDFLNVELVSKNNIKKCPPKLLTIPTRNILVKLHGLKPNPRWREVDILRELSERVRDRKIFTKIILSGEATQVELFESENDDTLIYDRLINERFYIKLGHTNNGN